MNTMVKVANLIKMYGDYFAVDNLSFSINKGEIYGLLGPNGAGKSTTMNIITTLNHFDKGTVTVDGLDARKDKAMIRKIIGLVPQDIAVYKHLNAYENVKFFASMYGLKKQELENSTLEALEFVGLKDRMRMKPKEMSGGMKRRLNIACGIAHSPKLIVMDEPTVGVDAQSRDHILHSIQILKERGATIIYTSHYMQEVEEICDRISIIDYGKLVATGTKEELVSLITDKRAIHMDVRFPSNVATEQLKQDLSTLPGVQHVTIDETHIRLVISTDFDDLTPIMDTIMKYHIPIQGMESENVNLDMTFLSLTGRELR